MGGLRYLVRHRVSTKPWHRVTNHTPAAANARTAAIVLPPLAAAEGAELRPAHHQIIDNLGYADDVTGDTFGALFANLG